MGDWKRKRKDVATPEPTFITHEQATEILAPYVNPRLPGGNPERFPPVQFGYWLQDQLTRQCIRRKLYYQLRKLKLVPTPVAIAKLKTYMNEMWRRATLEAGTAIGVEVAHSLSAPAMQMTLNSFHTSGGRTMEASIASISELIFARNRTKTAMHIHFEDKYLTVDELFDVRGEFVGNSVWSLIVEKDIELEAVKDLDRFWWQETYPLITGKVFPANPDTPVLRLYMNVNRMYAMKITLQDVVKAIEAADDTRPIICMHSPMEDGVIDVYPVDKTVALAEGVPGDIYPHVRLLLSKYVTGRLRDIIVRGIPGIDTIEIVSEKIWALVSEQKFIGTATAGAVTRGNRWEISLNPKRMRVWNITLKRFEDLLVAMGLQIEGRRTIYLTDDTEANRPYRENEVYRHYLQCVMPAEAVDARGKPLEPKAYLDRQLEEIGKRIRAARVIGTTLVTEAERRLVDLSQYNYLLSQYEKRDTDSKGVPVVAIEAFYTVLGLRGVDTTVTYCNNMKVVAAVLGIGATRMTFIREYQELMLASDQYVPPAYIAFGANYITSVGRPIGVTSAGAKTQKSGVLSMASFDKALPTITSHAAFGRREGSKSIRGSLPVSASIMIGQSPHLGVGMTSVEVTPRNEEKRREILRQLEEAKLKKSGGQPVTGQINLQDLTKEIDALDDIFGQLTLGAAAGAELKAQVPSGSLSGIQPPLPQISVQFAEAQFGGPALATEGPRVVPQALLQPGVVADLEARGITVVPPTPFTVTPEVSVLMTIHEANSIQPFITGLGLPDQLMTTIGGATKPQEVPSVPPQVGGIPRIPRVPLPAPVVPTRPVERKVQLFE